MIPYSRPKFSLSIPYPRLNCSKTLPFTAAHTYVPYIWKYPPGPGGYNILIHIGLNDFLQEMECFLPRVIFLALATVFFELERTM